MVAGLFRLILDVRIQMQAFLSLRLRHPFA
jgi:hypothetical protein